MGQGCSCGKKPKTQNKIQSELKYKNTSIQIVKGDIAEEETDIIINSSDIPYNPQTSQIVRRAGARLQQQLSEKDQLNQGQIEHSIGGLLKCKYIVHQCLPHYQGIQKNGQYCEDIKNFSISFYNVLLKCRDLNQRKISFSDLQNDRQLDIPIIFFLNSFMMAFHYFLLQYPSTQIECIRFVSSNDTILRNMQFEVEKKLDVLKIPTVLERFNERDAQLFRTQNSANLNEIKLNMNENQYNNGNQALSNGGTTAAHKNH